MRLTCQNSREVSAVVARRDGSDFLPHTTAIPLFQPNRSGFAYAAFEALVVTETRVILPEAASWLADWFTIFRAAR